MQGGCLASALSQAECWVCKNEAHIRELNSTQFWDCISGIKVHAKALQKGRGKRKSYASGNTSSLVLRKEQDPRCQRHNAFFHTFRKCLMPLKHGSKLGSDLDFARKSLSLSDG
eukprot:scaffold87490_cov16-Tisochrysis_lutea.AAC.1